MRRHIRSILGTLLVVSFLLSGCYSVKPDAGQEAVLIQKPLLFGHGGVDPYPVKPGRTFVAITTDAVYVNMLPQQYQIHFEDFMSKDGVPLDFDAVIRLQVLDSVKLVSQFGPKWYENNIHAEFANRVRQAVRKHGMNETAIKTEAIEDIDREVTEAMSAYLREAGLPVALVQVTVGRANPPDAIKDQRIQTAKEEQRRITEEHRQLAEVARKAAEESRAAADNAYREAMQLSTTQLLELEQIKMLREVCARAACTFIHGAAAVSPVLDVAKSR